MKRQLQRTRRSLIPGVATGRDGIDAHVSPSGLTSSFHRSLASAGCDWTGASAHPAAVLLSVLCEEENATSAEHKLPRRTVAVQSQRLPEQMHSSCVAPRLNEGVDCWRNCGLRCWRRFAMASSKQLLGKEARRWSTSGYSLVTTIGLQVNDARAREDFARVHEQLQCIFEDLPVRHHAQHNTSPVQRVFVAMMYDRIDRACRQRVFVRFESRS